MEAETSARMGDLQSSLSNQGYASAIVVSNARSEIYRQGLE